ncbi:hypothetical protein KIMC2_00830 [Xylocopilactobacillus apis]|uniref:Uncharacterized protein n=2 Tax=Xylocopilactobacillus apis TaxID=2932183 RepID=A0AAU9CT20_9LACO|nr:hypothetical protein KIMC2_00830 [Xylocopilactobacillus apis]
MCKRKFEDLINKEMLNPENVENIYFFADEHSTATNGKYELTEGLEQEFKFGTNNWNYSKFFPPIFPSMSSISLDYCNSQRKILIRSADIIANKLLYSAKQKTIPDLQKENFIITTFPNN